LKFKKSENLQDFRKTILNSELRDFKFLSSELNGCIAELSNVKKNISCAMK